MEMKVKEIIYNWCQTGSTQDRDGAGEDSARITIGEYGVLSIEEHKAAGEGDKWNYLVEFEDGHFLRIFNPNTVEYFKTEHDSLKW